MRRQPVSEENVCGVCHVPSRQIEDNLCFDCRDMADSPYYVAEGKTHAFLYAPTTTYQTEFCRACGKGRDSSLHDGSSTMADVYTTHHATQGDAA